MRWIRLVPLAALLLASGPTLAMWRCGNVYQDRPCEGGGPEQKLLKNGRPAPVPKQAVEVSGTGLKASPRTGLKAPGASPTAASAQPAGTTKPTSDGKAAHWSCPDLRRRHGNNATRLQKGGSAVAMEALQNERREIERDMGANGC